MSKKKKQTKWNTHTVTSCKVCGTGIYCSILATAKTVINDFRITHRKPCARLINVEY